VAVAEVAVAEVAAGGATKVPSRGAAAGGNARGARGTPVVVEIRKGRLCVKVDPAIRDPRDPPGYDPKDKKWHHRETSLPADLFSYLKKGDKVVGRVLIYREHRSFQVRGKPRPIENEFGSLTIDAITWMPLAITPRPFAAQINVNAVNKFINEGRYEIVVTSDGTLGTLYRWHHVKRGPIWCIATQRGYDVFPLDWADGRTWAEMLHGLLKLPSPSGKPLAEVLGAEYVEDCICDGDARIDFRNLDDTYCYTICMRDHGLQPLLSDPQGIWSVQMVSLEPDSRFQPKFSQDVPHFPPQVIIGAERLQEQIRELLGGGNGITVKNLHALCKTSIEEATAAIAEPLRAAKGFQFNYGYILRSRNRNATGDCSDIIIESPLLNRVRHLMYSPPGSSSPDHDRITPSNKLEYYAMRGILNKTYRSQVLALFPQFTALDSQAREFLNNVQYYVITKSRAEAVQTAEIPPYAMPSDVTSLGDEVLRTIQEKYPNFNGFERGTAEVTVRSYLYDATAAMFVLTVLGRA